MEFARVQGHNHLVRDMNSNSIINTNMTEYQEYVSRRDSKSKDNEKIQNLESDIANIKSDVDEIKNLLRSLVNGSK